MRFLTAAAFALASVASLVAAQENPIINPTAGTIVKAGEPVTIEWTPTTTGKITLRLRSGDDKALDTDAEIAADVTNSGKYTWTPSEDLAPGKDYTIEISTKEGANYSPRFSLDSEGKGLTTTKTGSTTSTSTKTVSTTTETETETSTTTEATTTETEAATNTTTTRKPTKTAAEDEEDIPNTNDKSAGYKAASPIALVFCLAMAVVYLN